MRPAPPRRPPAAGVAGPSPAAGILGSREVPVVIATLLRREGPSGVQTHLGEFERYLRGRELPVSLVTAFSAAGVMGWGAFGLRRMVEPLSGAAGVLWYGWSHRVFLERGLRRALGSLGPAIVYCQCPVSAAAALGARRGPEQRVVLAVHFLVSQADEWVVKHKIVREGRAFRTIRELERQVVREVDGVVFVSDAARSALWLGEVPGVPTVTIPNFVAMPRALPGMPKKADLVTVGSLEAHKNHTFLLETLAAAARSGHRYTLDIVGDGPERRSLARRSHALGLDEQVRLLGAVPRAARLLPGYRAYVHAATREALPLAVIEAMAAGLPVLAAPVGGIPQLFDDPAEGRFWPLDDPCAAAELLVALLSDESVRADAGAAARRRACAQFDAAVVGDALHRFLVDPPGAPREQREGRSWNPGDHDRSHRPPAPVALGAGRAGGAPAREGTRA